MCAVIWALTTSRRGHRNSKVDTCTYCEGIWLDAGEMEHVARMDRAGLDKLFGVFKK